MTDEARPRSASKIIALAVVAGLAASAVAIYVSSKPSGNTGRETADACEAKRGAARSVGDAATGDVAAMSASEPQSLQHLSFSGPDGGSLTLAGFSGKTLLINLWATWCAPCRAEMPAFDSLQSELGGDRFEVVAINVETGPDEKPRKFLTEIGIEHLAFYRDDTLGVFNDLKKRSLSLGLPVTLLVDRDGCLLANMNGPAEWGGEDAKRLIETALAGG